MEFRVKKREAERKLMTINLISLMDKLLEAIIRHYGKALGNNSVIRKSLHSFMEGNLMDFLEVITQWANGNWWM